MQHDADDETTPMLKFWHSATMLAIESGEVVGLRLVRLAGGGDAAVREVGLMCSEKVAAFAEATVSVYGGATPAHVVGRYREHVAANAARLAS